MTTDKQDDISAKFALFDEMVKALEAANRARESIERNQEVITGFIRRVDGKAAAVTYTTIDNWKRNLAHAYAVLTKLKEIS